MDFENLCNISVFYLSTISPTLHTALHWAVLCFGTLVQTCAGSLVMHLVTSHYLAHLLHFPQAHLADVNNKNNCVDRYIYIFMIVVT